MLKKLMYGAFTLSLFAVVQGCSTTGHPNIQHSQALNLTSHTRIAVVPFYNTTDSSGAGARAAIITAGLLRTDNFDVASAPYFEHKKMKHDWKMMERCHWAHEHQVPYIMKGSVNEWGYIANPNGNVPAVSISLQLRETENCSIVWNAVGSKTGHRQISVSGEAQKLISHMLRSLSADHKAS